MVSSSFFTFSLIALVIFPYSHICASAQDVPPLTDENDVKRADFPKDFRFGASTSAIQIEGAINEDGRKSSIQEVFLNGLGKKYSVDIAVDSYHRYKQDIQDLKGAGLDSFRFSISWPRILPDGTLQGGVNPLGIKHYNDLIDELLRNGITPFVTLFHFDTPEALQEKYNGFLNRSIVDDFKAYSEVCFKAFGDRVKHWITINEPLVVADVGYGFGSAAPGRCSKPLGNCKYGNSLTEPYIVAHNLILAHAAAARLYKEEFQDTQKGEIGISLVTEWYEPYSESIQDKQAVDRVIDFISGWFIGPLTYGDYPSTMKASVKDRLPNFTDEEKKMVMGSTDFIGINYYGARYAKDIPIVSPTSFMDDMHLNRMNDRDGIPIGKKFDVLDSYFYPKGIKNILVYMKQKYKSPKMYITENGITEARNDSLPIIEALKDPQRIDAIQKHLHYIREATREGADVNGYFIWTLMDSSELASGYDARFGLYYTDYNDNYKRYPKDSAKWLNNFLLN